MLSSFALGERFGYLPTQKGGCRSKLDRAGGLSARVGGVGPTEPGCEPQDAGGFVVR